MRISCHGVFLQECCVIAVHESFVLDHCFGVLGFVFVGGPRMRASCCGFVPRVAQGLCAIVAGCNVEQADLALGGFGAFLSSRDNSVGPRMVKLCA